MEISKEKQQFFDQYPGVQEPHKKLFLETAFNAAFKITKEAILTLLNSEVPCCSCCGGNEAYDGLVKKIEEMSC